MGQPIGFPLIIADSGRDVTGIKHGLLGWHTNALTTEIQIWVASNYCPSLASNQNTDPKVTGLNPQGEFP